MRIKLNFSKNTTSVSINNQSKLNGYIHKCLGTNNEYHDTWSNYSISHLYGGKLNPDKETLNFENGGYVIVSSLDTSFMEKIIMGVMLHGKDLFGGMQFIGLDHINEKFYDGWNHFATLSPFLIKEKVDGKDKFVTMDDVDFKDKVKDSLIRKLSKFSPKTNLDDFDVIIPKRKGNKIKSIKVKNNYNKSNQCQVSIKCSAEVAKLIYNLGIGQSTGSGFGTIFKTESKNIYW